MYFKNWKKEIRSIPNLLSLFRIALIPIYVVIYLNATEVYQYVIAAMILAVSCLTDMVDGKIARHYNMITNLGIVLDPFADKLTQFTLTVCLSVKHPILIPVLVLFFCKELFQLIATIVNYQKGKVLSGALMIGKICTTVLFMSLTALVMFPYLSEDVVNIIALVDSCFLGVAFISYVFAFFGKHAKVHDLDNNT